MAYIVHTGTFQKFRVGQEVKANGMRGVIEEIRDYCKFPIFVSFDGRVDAFLWSEVVAT